jgi:uncharacterized membrane protein YkvA (DUF1232 family)
MAQNEIDERLEALKRSGDGGEGGQQPPEADDLSAAVAEDFANHNGEAASEDAFAGGEETPSAGLLSFYDRLRDRVVDAVERRGGKLGPAVVKALLLVPDVFILMVRLTLDREVPASARAMIGGALAYFILPVDLLPEAVIGAGGYLDDLVLASAVLAQTFSGELEPYARKHWSGREDLREVLADVAEAAQGLLGHDMYGRVRKLLGKRGIRVED